MLLHLSILVLLLLCPAAWTENFYQDATVTFGDQRAHIQDGGCVLALSLDKISGSGFQSKNEYLFGRFDIQLKLVPGNSAGTVTTFYVITAMRSHRVVPLVGTWNFSATRHNCARPLEIDYWEIGFLHDTPLSQSSTGI
ncbi:Xyloglucan endotransglucosylase/hydrolase 2 [Capsicum annuum]|nr:Xyloglucan endotransglucosylase/hydrolase 2 [Capsicum annuum]